MRVCIPSYGRAKDQVTARWLTSAIIFVHEDQKKEYEDYNANEVIGIPDEREGTITKARNYILDYFKGEDVLMMDDDVEFVGYFEGVVMNRAEKDYFLEFADNMFLMTKELGTKVWGVNLQSDKKFYREYSPFSLSSVVCGTLMAIVNDTDLRFDERFFLKEDFDFSVQVLKKYRKILRNNKWFYVASHLTKGGGCSKDRNQEKELEQMMLFEKKWGSSIVRAKRKTQGGRVSTNPIVKIPIKGI